jgi:hypothetical protein
MRVERATLINFRSHKHTVVTFERINFVRGMNRTGKSGIAMAIEMTLAGRCAVTDEGGKGFEQLIRQDEQRATVKLECSCATITLTLDRTVGRTLKVETGRGTPEGLTILGKQAQEWIAENIATPDVVNASLNAWRFMKSGDNEQAALLARVLLPAKLELSSDVTAWLAGSGLAIVERSSLFGTIEATHKAISTARTDVNRTLRDMKAITEPEPVVGSSATIKEKLDQLRTEHDALNQRLFTATHEDEITERRKVRLATVDTELKVAAVAVLDASKKLLSTEDRTQLEQKATLRNRQEQLRETLTLERANLDRIAEALDYADDGRCAACKQPLPADVRTAGITTLNKRRTESKKIIERLEKELRASLDGEAAAKQIAADNANRKLHQEAETTLERWRQEERDLTGSVSVVSSIDASESETIESLREKIAALQAKVTRGLDLLGSTAAREEQHAVYQRQLKLKINAERKLSDLEKLLEYFGPRGIKAKLIAERLDMFTERVNAVLDWWGYSLSFSIEPYALTITEVDGPALTPKQLSDSERYRLGVAFGIAIADWTGLRLLIADGADILDKTDKWQLAQALLQSDLEQAIVTSTGVAGTFDAAGTAFYTLSKSGGVTATEVDAITEVVEEAHATR